MTFRLKVALGVFVLLFCSLGGAQISPEYLDEVLARQIAAAVDQGDSVITGQVIRVQTTEHTANLSSGAVQLRVDEVLSGTNIPNMIHLPFWQSYRWLPSPVWDHVDLSEGGRLLAIIRKDDNKNWQASAVLNLNSAASVRVLQDIREGVRLQELPAEKRLTKSIALLSSESAFLRAVSWRYANSQCGSRSSCRTEIVRKEIEKSSAGSLILQFEAIDNLTSLFDRSYLSVDGRRILAQLFTLAVAEDSTLRRGALRSSCELLSTDAVTRALEKGTHLRVRNKSLIMGALSETGGRNQVCYARMDRLLVTYPSH